MFHIFFIILISWIVGLMLIFLDRQRHSIILVEVRLGGP
jgi:hypothetical protein